MTHTIETSDEQDNTLAWLVATNNAENHTGLSVEQFLQLQLGELLRPYILRYHAAEAEAVKAGFLSQADPGVRARMKSDAGVVF